MSTTHPDAPTRHPVAESHQVAEGGRYVVDLGDLTIGVFRFQGALYAYENVCAHQGGPVCQGRLVHRVVEVLDSEKRSTGAVFDADELRIVCPWHGAEYNVATGKHPTQPAFTLRAFPVDEEGGTVHVTV
jgi:nitrite reductase/ring-hydroxylating ferredoxin subunit